MPDSEGGSFCATCSGVGLRTTSETVDLVGGGLSTCAIPPQFSAYATLGAAGEAATTRSHGSRTAIDATPRQSRADLINFGRVSITHANAAGWQIGLSSSSSHAPPLEGA